MAKKQDKPKSKPKRRRSTRVKFDYRKAMVPLFASMGAGFLGEMVKKDGKPMIPRVKSVGLEGTYGPLLIGFGALSKGKTSSTLLDIGTALTNIGANKLGASFGKSFVKAQAEKKAKTAVAGYMDPELLEDPEIAGYLGEYAGEGVDFSMVEGDDYSEFEPDANYYNEPVSPGFVD